MIVDTKTLGTMVNAYLATQHGTLLDAMRAAVACIPVACPPREELAQALLQEDWTGVSQCPALKDLLPGDLDALMRQADRALALCAGRVPAEVCGLVERWHRWVPGQVNERFDRSVAADELEAALQSLPQPASPPDALPVPGAAVRALVEEFPRCVPAMGNRDYQEGYRGGLHRAVSELEAALRSDKLAVELPTREQLAPAIRQAYFGRDCKLWGEAGEVYFRVADYVLDLLRQHAAPKPTGGARFEVTREEWDSAQAKARVGAYQAGFDAHWHLNAVLARRPATDAVRPAVCTLEQARRIEQRSGMGPFACTAFQLRDAINAELRPAADEAEADGPAYAQLQKSHDLALEQVRDLESQLAAVTAERDKLARERDQLRAEVADDDRLRERVERLERDNGLVWKLVEHHTQASLNTVIRDAADEALNARKGGD